MSDQEYWKPGSYWGQIRGIDTHYTVKVLNVRSGTLKTIWYRLSTGSYWGQIRDIDTHHTVKVLIVRSETLKTIWYRQSTGSCWGQIRDNDTHYLEQVLNGRSGTLKAIWYHRLMSGASPQGTLLHYSRKHGTSKGGTQPNQQPHSLLATYPAHLGRWNLCSIQKAWQGRCCMKPEKNTLLKGLSHDN